MDKKTAAILLYSLLERIERDNVIGTVSSLERQALQLALRALDADGEIAQLSEPTSKPSGYVPATESVGQNLPSADNSNPTSLHDVHSTAIPVALPKVELDLSSIEREEVTDPNVLMCIDFGTAMSKAFATVLPAQYLDLELGAEAGGHGYTLPSSVFIGDNGKAYFGFEAIEMSQDLVDSGRERLDSIKGWLSLRREGNLDGEGCVLQKAMNPTHVRLTQGDLFAFTWLT